MNMIVQATLFADKAHDGQVRKFTGLPYISHTMEVMQIVRGVTNDDDVIAAAVLHDVIEDCGITYTELFTEFNERIAYLVYQVTNAAYDEDGNRDTRAYINRTLLRDVSADAQTIKLADIISNVSGVDIALECDPVWTKTYLEEKRELLKVLNKGDRELKMRAYNLVEKGIEKCLMR
jgi:guanosine-3',5'-bis(diphosphate) 3'-pyrophosphohydrolase